MYKISEKDLMDLYLTSNDVLLKSHIKRQYHFIIDSYENKKSTLLSIKNTYKDYNIHSFVYKCIANYIKDYFNVKINIDDIKNIEKYSVFARRWTSKYLKENFNISNLKTSVEFYDKDHRSLSRSVVVHDREYHSDEIYKSMYDKCCAYVDKELYLIYKNDISELKNG